MHVHVFAAVKSCDSI